MLDEVFKCEERQGLPFPCRLGSLLGVGGMGVVYELEGSGCDNLAVKFVHPGIAYPQAAQAQLEHESLLEMHLQGLASVVQTLEYRHGSLSQAYKVMRRIKGRVLSKRVDMDLKKSVFEALSKVHQQGIVHGDLKPSNIMIDEQGQIVLLDFGLGRFLHDSSCGAVMNQAYTPQYASWRVLSGCLPEIEDDLYSLDRIFKV